MLFSTESSNIRLSDAKITLIFLCHLILKSLFTFKEAGTKVLASQLFWIVEQDAVVEWALLR